MSDISIDKKFKTRPWIITGLFVLVIVFAGGGFWATTSSISGAIIAPGLIGVESKIKTVEHLEGGIVEEIYVTNGVAVHAGDALLRLDDTSLQANLNIISNNLFEMLARRARLEAELGDDDVISFPEEIQNDNTTVYEQRILDSKSALFETRRQARIGQKQIMSQQILHLEDQIKGLETQKSSLIEQSGILQGNIDRKEAGAESGIITQDAMDLVRRQYIQVQGDIGALQSDIARIRSTITQTELKILQIDVGLRENIQGELRDVLNSIAELREKKVAFEDRLSRTVIIAPVTGLVHNMSIFTVGGVIAPARPILQIIPTDDRLIIEARINISDVDQISIGQPASVSLTAFDTRNTPRLEATVTSISAAQLTDAGTNIPYFKIEIEIPPNQLSRLNEDQKLLPGMPAESFIQTGDRSPMDYILKPLLVQAMHAFKES